MLTLNMIGSVEVGLCEGYPWKSPPSSTSTLVTCCLASAAMFDNLAVLNVILHAMEHGCKWRGLPERFGNWHTIYSRMRPVVEQGCARPGIRGTAMPGDRAHPAGGGVAGQHGGEGASRRDGCPEKNGAQTIGKSRGGWSTKIHMVAADARTAIGFSLSPGQAGDAPKGRNPLSRLPVPARYLVMDAPMRGGAGLDPGAASQKATASTLGNTTGRPTRNATRWTALS